MRNFFLFFLSAFCLASTASAQDTSYRIITSDIDHFWAAYDNLAFAHTTQDSLNIIQHDYIDKGSTGLVEFLKARPYTAKNYIKAIAAFPGFWKSLRPRTALVKKQKQAIEKIYSTYFKYLPDFKPPNVCFAIGALRSGGTTTKNWILIGTEIAAADSLTDTTEFKGWLKQKLGKGNAMSDIISLVAHEAVHTQQTHTQKETLLSMTINEGAADFIPELLLGLHVNKAVHEYGTRHECALWKQYKSDLKHHAPISNWLYSFVKDRPADLGYFVGARICSSYYDRMANKKHALKVILKSGAYKRILKKSHYDGNCSR